MEIRCDPTQSCDYQCTLCTWVWFTHVTGDNADIISHMHSNVSIRVLHGTCIYYSVMFYNNTFWPDSCSLLRGCIKAFKLFEHAFCASLIMHAMNHP